MEPGNKRKAYPTSPLAPGAQCLAPSAVLSGISITGTRGPPGEVISKSILFRGPDSRTSYLVDNAMQMQPPGPIRARVWACPLPSHHHQTSAQVPTDLPTYLAMYLSMSVCMISLSLSLSLCVCVCVCVCVCARFTCKSPWQQTSSLSCCRIEANLASVFPRIDGRDIDYAPSQRA